MISDGVLARRIDSHAESLTDDWPYEPVGAMLITLARKYLSHVHDYPVSLGCALVHQESWFRNIFGCDWGERWTTEPPYCQIRVTEGRVARLLRNIREGGGENGVGLTQLTAQELVMRAENLGGAHIPKNQLIVGFALLGSHIQNYGYYGGVGAYNAGPGNRWAVRHTYTQQLEDKHNAWINRLT